MPPDRNVQLQCSHSAEVLLRGILESDSARSQRRPMPVLHRHMQMQELGAACKECGARRGWIGPETHQGYGKKHTSGFTEPANPGCSHRSHVGHNVGFSCWSNHDRHRTCTRQQTLHPPGLAGRDHSWPTQGDRTHNQSSARTRNAKHCARHWQLVLERPLCLLLKVLGLAAFLTSCQAQTLNCTAGASGNASIVETQCFAKGGNSWHFFEVTVTEGAADELVTYISSPSSATCSGPSGGFLCSPPLGQYTSYVAMSGEGCVPDELNNNWHDLTPTFSKQVTVCKPCLAGTYWLAFKLLQDTSCDLKVWIPSGSKPESSATTCSIASRTSRGGGGDACTGGLQRTNLAPVVVTQCELPDGRACLFGACNDWLWLAAWFGAGAFPSLIFAVCVCVYRRRYKKERKVHEDAGIYNNVAVQVPMYTNNNDVVVQDLNTADLNKEFDSDADDDNLPDQLPPTFFVNDRYDAN